MKNIVVIGAGASGIIASLKLSEKYHVILLEKCDKIGKKILVTGNGKCNLWNLNLLKKDCDFKKYYYTDSYERLNDIFKYSNEVYQYLTSDLGIFVKNKEEYVYPYSQTATSIRETLEHKLLKNPNIDVICNCEVTKIENDNNLFKVYSNNEYFEANKVVIACGYKSSNLGTSSLDNLISSDIQINKDYPALVPIKLDTPYLKRWNGIRSDARVSLISNGSVLKEEIGEVQLTDYGISGIVSLNLSSLVNKNMNSSLEVEIDFMPDINSDILLKVLSYKDETVEEVLETMFNYKLMFILLDEANIDKDTKWNNLSDAEKNKMFSVINHFKARVTGTLGYDRSQVTTGGISLNEVSSSLELIKNNKIFVTGEILDIDGICGGYNLASAFITGYIVGSSIND